jgi:methylmalonyl-CoA/ethylmalonyl-CoA epimerase
VIRKVHHVSYVVHDLEAVMTFLRVHFGMEPTWVGSEERGRLEVTYDIGDAELQIKQPVSEQSGLAAFLRDRGPGIHHVAWAASGLDALATNLSSSGVALREGALPHRSGESSHPRLSTTYRVLNVLPESGHGLGERLQIVEDDA